MKGYFLRLASIAIIAGILFVNLRNFASYFSWNREQNSPTGYTVNLQTSGTTVANLIGEISDEKITCIPLKKIQNNSQSGTKIILRIDDISVNTPVPLLKKLVIDTERYHIPLVLSIVAEGIEKNTELVQFLRNESCNLEYAIHGWDHFGVQSTIGNNRFISEFGEISYEDALTRIKNAKQVLSTLTNEPIITLIPPYNLISASGVLAAKNSGIHVISSIGTGTFDAYRKTNTLENFEPFRRDEIIENCKKSLENSQICTILLSISQLSGSGNSSFNSSYYYEYLGLLEDFSKNGVEFTTFRELQKNWKDFPLYSLIK